MPRLGAIRACLAVSILAVRPSTAEPIPADQLPASLLTACEARSKRFGRYDKPVAEAVDGLIELGVFEQSDFRDVKVGFCELREAQGPVATTACANDIILLDAKYTAKDQALTLKATLAHEMKHVLQHRRLKAQYGDAHCNTDQYRADKDWMEIEADAFGDAVAALFVIGRPVEVVNKCPVPIYIYLEADEPMTTGAAVPTFLDAAPNATTPSTERSASNRFKFYAETRAENGTETGEKRVWRGATRAHLRYIEGGAYPLKRVVLTNPIRSSGPFRMTLSCKSVDAP